MSKDPLVSIICLCYNHKPYLEEAILSAINQTYGNMEIIIVDDFSTDGSREIITDLTSEYQGLTTLLLDQNHGNTVAFNKGYALSKGEFIIDLATDDVLMPNRVKFGVHLFQKFGISYGVNFTNATLIDANGKSMGSFYPVDSMNQAITQPASGDIYKDLIEKFFICPPTMMYRREVLDALEGYDESLLYEDFDFWIRSSRIFEYCYTDQLLVKRRKLPSGLASKQFTFGNRHMLSTYEVCKKIKSLNKNKAEDNALKRRIWYEMKQCIKYMNPLILIKYWNLLLKV